MGRIRGKGERGFTLIELLIVVAILGILAAVVVPNVGRFLGSGKSEARNTEYQNVVTAVSAMMVNNGISTLNDPVNEVAEYSAACIAGATGVGQNDMTKFPDGDTLASVKDDSLGGTGTANDGNGWILFGHDILMNDANPASAKVNYMATQTTSYCYAVAADGTVSQYEKGGTTPTNGPGV